MRKSGSEFKQSYPERLALVRRYLETDATAVALAAEAEVSESTFRRWVRELRASLEQASRNGHSRSAEAESEIEQGRFTLAREVAD